MPLRKQQSGPFDISKTDSIVAWTYQFVAAYSYKVECTYLKYISVVQLPASVHLLISFLLRMNRTVRFSRAVT